MTAADREHDLATARAYQDTYAGEPPHPDRWVRKMRDNNDAEVAELEAGIRAALSALTADDLRLMRGAIEVLGQEPCGTRDQKDKNHG